MSMSLCPKDTVHPRMNRVATGLPSLQLILGPFLCVQRHFLFFFHFKQVRTLIPCYCIKTKSLNNDNDEVCVRLLRLLAHDIKRQN